MVLSSKQSRGVFSAMSHNDFKDLGADHIAYVREFNDPLLNETRYIIYGADGRELAVVDNHDNAMATLVMNDMEAVTIQ